MSRSRCALLRWVKGVSPAGTSPFVLGTFFTRSGPWPSRRLSPILPACPGGTCPMGQGGLTLMRSLIELHRIRLLLFVVELPFALYPIGVPLGNKVITSGVNCHGSAGGSPDRPARPGAGGVWSRGRFAPGPARAGGWPGYRGRRRASPPGEYDLQARRSRRQTALALVRFFRASPRPSPGRDAGLVRRYVTTGPDWEMPGGPRRDPGPRGGREPSARRGRPGTARGVFRPSPVEVTAGRQCI